MKLIIEPVYGENSGAILTIERTSDEVCEGEPAVSKEVFTFDWFRDNTEPESEKCPMDGLIIFLYAILEYTGYCHNKYGQHNISISCEAGHKLDDDEVIKCPNRNWRYQK